MHAAHRPVLKLFLLAGCVLTLSGCPLFEKKQEHANSALYLEVTGAGVKSTGEDEYTYQLDIPTNPDNGLALRMMLDGRPVDPQAMPTSDKPDVVKRLDLHRLVAVGAGRAQINAVHAKGSASVKIIVQAGKPTASGNSVSDSSLWSLDQNGWRQTSAVETDNYKYGNGGMAGPSQIRAMILGAGGRPVDRTECRQFIANITPKVAPSGWNDDDREFKGVVEFEYPSNGWEGNRDLGRGICAFDISGAGFPILGSGVKRYMMTIHRNCAGKPCGKPLPGGAVAFGIRMQSKDECSYCEGR